MVWLVSHSIWVRELKFVRNAILNRTLVSHSIWVRELKSSLVIMVVPLNCRTLYGCVNWNVSIWMNMCGLLFVALYMGAWIEICNLAVKSQSTWRRTLYGCVNWNMRTQKRSVIWERRTLYGCVNWNSSVMINAGVGVGRTLYGCVNWNLILCYCCLILLMSHSIWVRELKLAGEGKRPIKSRSHSIWVRELKSLIQSVKVV
mgnify:CR=1 FL=1